MKVLCLFSSDSRQLYKNWVYEALALEKGSIINFRYDKKYVDENIINTYSNEKTIIWKTAYIFHTINNKDWWDIKNIPVRSCVIEKIEFNSSINLYFITAKLQDFKNITINSNNASEKTPPNKFFSELDTTIVESDDIIFETIVDNLKKSLWDVPYIFMEKFTKIDGANIKPKFDKSKNNSYYELIENTEYKINLSIHFPWVNKEIINEDKENLIISWSEWIQFYNKKNSIFERKNSVEYIFFTKPNEKHLQYWFINITAKDLSKESNMEYRVEIPLKIKRPVNKYFWFFLASLFIAVWIWISSFLTKKIPDSLQITTEWYIFLVILGVFSISISSTILYWIFNKK